MGMVFTVENLIAFSTGIVGGIIVEIILRYFVIGRAFFSLVFGKTYRLANILAEGGISRMTLERNDYHRQRVGAGQLRSYLATAKYSIEIVSISLNVTQAEGSLISLFHQRIHENDSFNVRITLLAPNCPAVEFLARSLDLEVDKLRHEITDTLRQLQACRSKLTDSAKKRFLIYTHDTLPIGSAILLDASPHSGRIQVETKLYRAPRIESFGFEVVGPSAFYGRNYIAWQKVFHDSSELVE